MPRRAHTNLPLFLLKAAEDRGSNYDAEKDRDLVTEDTGMVVLTFFLKARSHNTRRSLSKHVLRTTIGERDKARDWIFGAGQSKRIWSELYKVIDSSDVIVQVLDARDPMGTRSPYLEKYLKKDKAYKHLIFVLNKCDLVPVWSTVSFLCSATPFAPWARGLSTCEAHPQSFN